MKIDNDGYYQERDDALWFDADVRDDTRDRLRQKRESATRRKKAIRQEVERQLKAAGIEKVTNKPRGKMITASCLTCKKEFEARVADRKRGWAKYCSKSCKAKRQRNWSSYTS